ncbi:growth/differentiation factor 10 [Poecilia reticulata]|uniref:growth/differentiation factor 10 n=1 Tax=Poecilia reticulata TaxID=8081 RepID=UPI0004A500FF|nr:PREDICTED: growth/differentiation factor 10-like [Poecilia reticulata]XP_017166134.1 PREDICTED: growth/differentiation factor 10-like [Poecilia reticulata]
MATWLFHIWSLLVILAPGGAHLARQVAGARPEVDERVSARERASRDAVSGNMFKLYERYSEEPRSQAAGNTVRSFKAVPRVLPSKELFQFNLSSIQNSEIILSASFHFLNKRPRHHQRPWHLRKPRHLAIGVRHLPSSQLLFYGSSSNSGFAIPLGNISLMSLKKGSWQTRDVTTVVRQARDVNELVITVEVDVGFEAARIQQRGPLSHEQLSAANLPYILVYADDQAIDEPNSVALSLQRYGPFPVGDDASASTSASRIRRELQLQIETNDIPEVHFSTLKNHELWQNTYFPAKAKAEVKNGRKHGQVGSEAMSKPQVLNFDERTMKKARRRQWSEPRVCSRRYLRVDFADIGWSEWVLAPKSFDAYYCAGTCGFPIPKLAHPSNHATIQSIVRAVGIVPGIPEPCCVPDKMNSLSVLFLDPDRNMVLKVYPGMSVDTCGCR